MSDSVENCRSCEIIIETIRAANKTIAEDRERAAKSGKTRVTLQRSEDDAIDDLLTIITPQLPRGRSEGCDPRSCQYLRLISGHDPDPAGD
jgi:hypothetical protein